MSERGLTPEYIKSALCGLVEVEHGNQGFEVTLAQMYHTGHSVVIMVRPESGGFLVHDNSAAAMLLTSMGFAVGKRLTDGIRSQIAAYGCEISELRVWRLCESVDDLAVAMSLVGCASRLVEQTIREAMAEAQQLKKDTEL